MSTEAAKLTQSNSHRKRKPLGWFALLTIVATMFAISTFCLCVDCVNTFAQFSSASYAASSASEDDGAALQQRLNTLWYAYNAVSSLEVSGSSGI
jgi:hypothetical protein